jgi:hypothetical protein
MRAAGRLGQGSTSTTPAPIKEASLGIKAENLVQELHGYAALSDF